jgi:hypothetical protein
LSCRFLRCRGWISLNQATHGHDLIYFDLIQVTKPSTLPEFAAISGQIKDRHYIKADEVLRGEIPAART